jgi:hypothetical protein
VNARHLQAHRAPDPTDRRRLVITAVPGAFGKVFAGLDAAMTKLMARYSPAEQAVITSWVANTVDVLRETDPAAHEAVFGARTRRRRVVSETGADVQLPGLTERAEARATFRART